MLYSDQKLKAELQERIEYFKKDLKKIGTGKPDLDILGDILVEAYGIQNKLNAVSQIIAEDAVTVKITPWDKSIFPAVEKAIRDAELGLGISVEGSSLRLRFNPITEEDRRVKAKEVNKLLEEVRIRIRQIRQEYMKTVDSAEGVSEDEQERDRESIQREIDQYIKQVEEIAENKEKELMQI